MKDRILRLKTIRKLIKNNRIESQDELLNYLQNEGFEVTQATLSRDLKLMKVGKISDGHNGYVYTIPEDEIEKEIQSYFNQTPNTTTNQHNFFSNQYHHKPA